jgi:dTDP-4-dehydrorhamnose 3,5-epimerase
MVETDLEKLGGPLVIDVTRFGDERGYFCESYSTRRAADAGLDATFVQDNESLSTVIGTVRGLHFQLDPHAQGKLVRVAVGAVIDVVVDIRMSSPTFGQHAKIRLDSQDGRQLWVPPGFAHGFCSVTSDVLMMYKVTDFYNADADRSMRWDDPELGIEWPEQADVGTLSAKDSGAQTMAELGAKGELFK